MCKPHKHAALIKAWADGAKIQWYNLGVWADTVQPQWCPTREYRVKPNPLTIDECYLKAAALSNRVAHSNPDVRAEFMQNLIQLLKENNHV